MGGASPVTELINLVLGPGTALFRWPPAMPVCVLKEGEVPGMQAPSKLTRIPVAEISMGMDCSHKSVQVCPVRRAVSSSVWYWQCFSYWCCLEVKGHLHTSSAGAGRAQGSTGDTRRRQLCPKDRPARLCVFVTVSLVFYITNHRWR